jgi:hypothetical protein
VLTLARKSYLEGVADFPILTEKCALLDIDIAQKILQALP